MCTINLPDCCPDCLEFNNCSVTVYGYGTPECAVTLKVTCPNCSELLEESEDVHTDLICPCCLREYEITDNKLVCTK